MKKKPHFPNELDGKFKYVGDTVLRATIEGVDLCFIPGDEYENLPSSDYLYALIKQGFLKEIEVKKEEVIEIKSNSKPL